MTPPLRVLSVTSEIDPLVTTGGLANVAGALPAALEASRSLREVSTVVAESQAS